MVETKISIVITQCMDFYSTLIWRAQETILELGPTCYLLCKCGMVLMMFESFKKMVSTQRNDNNGNKKTLNWVAT